MTTIYANRTKEIYEMEMNIIHAINVHTCVRICILSIDKKFKASNFNFMKRILNIQILRIIKYRIIYQLGRCKLKINF